MGLNLGSILAGGVVSKSIDSIKGLVNQFVADPAQKEAINIEIDRHQETLIAQANDVEKSDLADVQNARNEEKDLLVSDKVPLYAKLFPYLMDSFIIALWGAMIVFVLLRYLRLIESDPKVDFTGILAILTGVTSLATTVINYHRGSSSGSKAKSDQIDKMMSK